MPTSSSASMSQHVTVLVVDDSEAMRDLVITSLRRMHASFTLVAASSAHQALAMVESYATLGSDSAERLVVISDVRMPGLDGIGLLRAVAVSPRPIDVVLMTAFPDARLRAQAHQLGARACLEKPFELETLQVLVAELLGTSG